MQTIKISFKDLSKDKAKEILKTNLPNGTDIFTENYRGLEIAEIAVNFIVSISASAIVNYITEILKKQISCEIEIEDTIILINNGFYYEKNKKIKFSSTEIPELIKHLEDTLN